MKKKIKLKKKQFRTHSQTVPKIVNITLRGIIRKVNPRRDGLMNQGVDCSCNQEVARVRHHIAMPKIDLPNF